MIKNISKILMFLLIIVSLVACGSKNNNVDVDTDAETNKVVTKTKDNSSEDVNKIKLSKEMDELLSRNFEDQSTGFKLRFPQWNTDSYTGYDYVCQRHMEGNYKIGEKAKLVFGQYWESEFNKQDKENIIIENIKTVDDIFTEMLEYKIITRYHSFDEYKFDYELLDKITVDGCEARKFKGSIYMKVQYGTLDPLEYTYQLVGYAIMGKNRPIIIWASDESEEQNQYEELSELVDAIVLTFEDGE